MGVEKHISWDRIDDGSQAGYAKLDEKNAWLMHAGDVVTMRKDDVHSVENDSPNDATAISLHVYGRDLRLTGRSMFEVGACIERPYLMDFEC